MYYEYHDFVDDQLKIIYHFDNLERKDNFVAHLHHNVELLLMKEGKAEITLDSETFTLSENEIAVISPNVIHKVVSISERCKYYCLIVDRSIYKDQFKPVGISFPLKTGDQDIIKLYKSVFETVDKKDICYRQETKAYIILMFSKLFKEAAEKNITTAIKTDDRRIDMTRNAISYMYENFSKNISVDDICSAVGFSKYYFCRSFKEITGQTPIWYLNYIRLKTAKAILKSGTSNITECALKCGFNNTSYFCKLYKRYFGNKPKADLKDLQM